MKKLLFVLLIVALASYLFVGCLPVTPDDGGEGEGEGEVATNVVIEGAVVIDGKTYVSAGNHAVTVTFPAPVAGMVEGSVDSCTGDEFAKQASRGTIVFWSDATKKVWTGVGAFENGECCATYVEINAGECDPNACIYFPVIVDGCPPYAQISVTIDDCECEGCALTFSSIGIDELCEEAELCCGDDCSGLASWSINLYNYYPFDVCCDPTICEEPIATDSGVCPVDFTTACLPELAEGEYYYAVLSLVDNVGLEQMYYARIEISGGDTPGGSDCAIVGIWEGTEADAPTCITWETADTVLVDDELVPYIGECSSEDCYYD